MTERFLADNKLELVIRSHEVKDKGYLVEHDGKLITVFSAPNYCDQVGNLVCLPSATPRFRADSVVGCLHCARQGLEAELCEFLSRPAPQCSSDGLCLKHLGYVRGGPLVFVWMVK